MIHYFYKEDQHIYSSTTLEIDKKKQLIWIDLLSPTNEERLLIEQEFKFSIPTLEERHEIESSSKFNQKDEQISINLNFMLRQKQRFLYEPVSFVLKKNLLVSERNLAFTTFQKVGDQIALHLPENGNEILGLILEIRVDFMADFIEELNIQIAALARQIKKNETPSKDFYIKLNALQVKMLDIRQNTIEVQRTLSALSRSPLFPKTEKERIQLILRDVISIFEYIKFDFERMESLRDTFQGLINIEQNKVMKVFTIMTAIFVPPTLISGIYGMNFTNMPELNQPWAYPFVLCLMLLLILGSLLFFKLKKWI